MDNSHEAQDSIREDAVAVPFGFLPASYGKKFSLAAVIHIFYEEISYEILACANNLPPGTKLFISTDTQMKRERIEKVFEGYKFGSYEVRIVPNRGRDIAPKIIGFRDVYESYEFVLHLHSKKSVHNDRLESWRPYLYETLSGSREQVQDILGIFERFPDIGMIFPQHYEYIRRWLTWGENFEVAARLAARLGYLLSPDHPLDFPSGSMFWARSAALKPLLDLDLSYDDFPPEAGQSDNTPAHAVERMYAIVCELAGYGWMKIARPEFLADGSSVAPIRNLAGLEDFIATNTRHLTFGPAPGPVDDFNSTQIPVSPQLAAIAEQHRQWLAFSEKFGHWTKAPLFPWGPVR
ncbi:MAG: hypothetical protein KBG72_07430 [Agrobacterium sp.]|nr:hypothetical protein [Agrobacterium sp.]